MTFLLYSQGLLLEPWLFFWQEKTPNESEFFLGGATRDRWRTYLALVKELYQVLVNSNQSFAMVS